MPPPTPRELQPDDFKASERPGYEKEIPIAYRPDLIPDGKPRIAPYPDPDTGELVPTLICRDKDQMLDLMRFVNSGEPEPIGEVFLERHVEPRFPWRR